MAFSNSNYSNIASATTQPAPTVQLATPINLTATALVPAPTDTTAKIQLTWISNSASNESGFGVERATSSSGPFILIATTGKNVTSYLNTGLPFSTTFYWRVRALA